MEQPACKKVKHSSGWANTSALALYGSESDIGSNNRTWEFARSCPMTFRTPSICILTMLDKDTFWRRLVAYLLIAIWDDGRRADTRLSESVCPCQVLFGQQWNPLFYRTIKSPGLPWHRLGFYSLVTLSSRILEPLFRMFRILDFVINLKSVS